MFNSLLLIIFDVFNNLLSTVSVDILIFDEYLSSYNSYIKM